MFKPGLALVVVAGAALIPAAAAAHPGSSGTMVEQMNVVRAEHGLRSLKSAPRLTRSTRDYARRIILTDRFAHALPYPTRHRDARVGEILAYHHGARPQVASTVAGWLASPAHRSVLLDPAFRFVGAGSAAGLLGGARATAWVARFST